MPPSCRSMFLVGLSSTRGARPAAGDQPGLGMGRAGLRLRPGPEPAPDPRRIQVLAGALVATAVAVSAYGLYQVRVEIPQLQATIPPRPPAGCSGRRSCRSTPPAQGLRGPAGAARRGLLHLRPGELAGGLPRRARWSLGAGTRSWPKPGRREGTARTWGAIVLAALPLLCILICLILTKSRSAYIGLWSPACPCWPGRRGGGCPGGSGRARACGAGLVLCARGAWRLRPGGSIARSLTQSARSCAIAGSTGRVHGA